MKSDGTGVKRISFGKGLYGTPVCPQEEILLLLPNYIRANFILV